MSPFTRCDNKLCALLNQIRCWCLELCCKICFEITGQYFQYWSIFLFQLLCKKYGTRSRNFCHYVTETFIDVRRYKILQSDVKMFGRLFERLSLVFAFTLTVCNLAVTESQYSRALQNLKIKHEIKKGVCLSKRQVTQSWKRCGEVRKWEKYVKPLGKVKRYSAARIILHNNRNIGWICKKFKYVVNGWLSLRNRSRSEQWRLESLWHKLCPPL